MKKAVNFGVLVASAYILAGCAAMVGSSQCSPQMIKEGYFCYSGINFGKNLSPFYKRGIVDGCRTGQGYFFKDYQQFKSSEEYKKGWMLGRKTCRPNYDDNYKNETKRGVVPTNEEDSNE